MFCHEADELQGSVLRYTDAIAAHQVGIINTVATGGTALTANQLKTIRPIASTITLLFEGDPPGLQAAERLADLLQSSIGGFPFK